MINVSNRIMALIVVIDTFHGHDRKSEDVDIQKLDKREIYKQRTIETDGRGI